MNLSPYFWQPLVAVLAVMYIFLFIIAIVYYVFYSLSIYTIAKRKQIPHAWMAWVPIVNGIVLGKVSYTPDKKRSTHIVLPILEGALWVVMIVFCVVLIGMMGSASHAFLGRGPMIRNFDMLGFAFALIAVDFLLLGVSIAYSVVYFMALYRIFKQFAPEYTTVFTVMSILFGLSPFFLFAVRNKPYQYAAAPSYAPVSPVPPALEGAPEQPQS